MVDLYSVLKPAKSTANIFTCGYTFGCEPHDEISALYCSACSFLLMFIGRSLVCKDCSQGHISRGHQIIDTGTAARQYQSTIAQLKKEITSEMEFKIKTLESFKEIVEETIKKVLSELESSINNFRQMVMEEALNTKSKLVDNVMEILNELERECSFTDCKDELAVLERFEETNNMLEVLSISGLSERLEGKKSMVERISRDIKLMEEEADGLISDCEQKTNAIRDYMGYSRLRLTELQLKKVEELKRLDEDLSEKTNEFSELFHQSDQIRKEINLLHEERGDIRDIIQKLTDHQAQLEDEIHKTHVEINELNKSKALLGEYILSRNKEIAKLDSILKSKEALKLNMQRAEQSFVKDSFKEIQQQSQASVIYVYEQIRNKLHVYEFGSGRSVFLPGKKFGILSNHGSVQVCNSLYITGGFNIQQCEFSRTSIQFHLSDLDDIKLEQKESMILAKSQHKLVALNAATLFSLGGKSKTSKSLKDCEKYNAETDSWEFAPSLNEPKANVSAIVLNAVCIYAFGGASEASECFVEVLEVGLDEWRVVEVKGHLQRESVGCFQLEHDKVMIFGGMKEKMGSTEEIYVFDINSKQLIKQPTKLAKREHFGTRTAVRLSDGRVCVAGCSAGDIHVFNADNTWSLVPVKEWKK
eukprot:TRINITY_DN117_c0_g3_i1.p1 TRINITY_DN117_c0_g3~~TRINITY_DN117_c0_g3_i1.p1  ORF type:complete len:645 (+),score=167.94 TRINITY_DN117_c0_g3_i1:95-2029(+)